MAVAYLLEARVVVTTNDDHLRLLLTSPLVGTVAKVYSDLEVGIVMESMSPTMLEGSMRIDLHG